MSVYSTIARSTRIHVNPPVVNQERAVPSARAVTTATAAVNNARQQQQQQQHPPPLAPPPPQQQQRRAGNAANRTGTTSIEFFNLLRRLPYCSCRPAIRHFKDSFNVARRAQPSSTKRVSTINQYANAATYVRATIVGSQAQQQRLEQSKRHAHDNVAANALKRPNVTVVKAIGTISAAIDLLARNVDANLEALSAAPVGHLPNDHQHRLLATSLEATSLNIHCKCATSRVPFEIFSFKFAYSTVRSHRCRTFIRCRHSSSLVID